MPTLLGGCDSPKKGSGAATPACDPSKTTCADDPCGKDAVSNVTKCCGLEIFEDAKRANGGNAPTIALGTPPAGFKGATDTSTGAITVSDTLDKCDATQVALFELTNMASKSAHDQVSKDAADGKLDRDEYTRRVARVEYDGLRRASAAEKNCMEKWGCKGRTPRHNWVDPARDFDDYYLNHTTEDYRNYYRNGWDGNYKAAYEAKHPPAPRR